MLLRELVGKYTDMNEKDGFFRVTIELTVTNKNANLEPTKADNVRLPERAVPTVLRKNLEKTVVVWLLGQSSHWPRTSEGNVKLEICQIFRLLPKSFSNHPSSH